MFSFLRNSDGSVPNSFFLLSPTDLKSLLFSFCVFTVLCVWWQSARYLSVHFLYDHLIHQTLMIPQSTVFDFHWQFPSLCAPRVFPHLLFLLRYVFSVAFTWHSTRPRAPSRHKQTEALQKQRWKMSNGRILAGKFAAHTKDIDTNTEVRYLTNRSGKNAKINPTLMIVVT